MNEQCSRPKKINIINKTINTPQRPKWCCFSKKLNDEMLSITVVYLVTSCDNENKPPSKSIGRYQLRVAVNELL
jgi:hypothetical protein